MHKEITLKAFIGTKIYNEDSFHIKCLLYPVVDFANGKITSTKPKAVVTNKFFKIFKFTKIIVYFFLSSSSTEPEAVMKSDSQTVLIVGLCVGFATLCVLLGVVVIIRKRSDR